MHDLFDTPFSVNPTQTSTPVVPNCNAKETVCISRICFSSSMAGLSAPNWTVILPRAAAERRTPRATLVNDRLRLAELRGPRAQGHMHAHGAIVPCRILFEAGVEYFKLNALYLSCTRATYASNKLRLETGWQRKDLPSKHVQREHFQVVFFPHPSMHFICCRRGGEVPAEAAVNSFVRKS